MQQEDSIRRHALGPPECPKGILWERRNDGAGGWLPNRQPEQSEVRPDEDALDAEYCEGAEDSGLRDEAYEDVLAYIREKVER